MWWLIAGWVVVAALLSVTLGAVIARCRHLDEQHAADRCGRPEGHAGPCSRAPLPGDL